MSSRDVRPPVSSKPTIAGRRSRWSHRPRQRCLVVQLPSPRTAPETLADRPERQPTHLLRPNPLPRILRPARPHTRTTRGCHGAATQTHPPEPPPDIGAIRVAATAAENTSPPTPSTNCSTTSAEPPVVAGTLSRVGRRIPSPGMRVEVEPGSGCSSTWSARPSARRPGDGPCRPCCSCTADPGLTISFRPYVDRFADSHQVLLVDHRGNGRSDGWGDPSGWNLDTWADDVVRLCDAPRRRPAGRRGPVLRRLRGDPIRRTEPPSTPASCWPAPRPAPTPRSRPLGSVRWAAPRPRRRSARAYQDRDLSTEAWLDYLRTNLRLYNPTPSPFGSARTIMNLELLVDFTGGEHVGMDPARRRHLPSLRPPWCSPGQRTR